MKKERRLQTWGTFPNATADVAMSSTKQSPFTPGAARAIGFVPRVIWKKPKGSRCHHAVSKQNGRYCAGDNMIAACVHWQYKILWIPAPQQLQHHTEAVLSHWNTPLYSIQGKYKCSEFFSYHQSKCYRQVHQDACKEDPGNSIHSIKCSILQQ